MLESTISVNSRTLSKRVDEGQWYQAPLALYPSGALFRPIPSNPTSTIKYLGNHFTIPSTPEHNIAQETFRASLASWTHMKIAPRNWISHHYPVASGPRNRKGRSSSCRECHYYAGVSLANDGADCFLRGVGCWGLAFSMLSCEFWGVCAGVKAGSRDGKGCMRVSPGWATRFRGRGVGPGSLDSIEL
jgi:hypothetical protein